MRCEEARELICEADLAELKMETDSPLSEHLRECSGCRRAADVILGTESAFAAAFDALTPGKSFEESVVTAVSTATLSSRKRSRVFPVLLPLAAAAVLLLLIFPLWNGEVEIVRDPLVPAIMAEAPEVRAPAEGSAMIIDSGDPDYQIIWLF
jgi:hypothetical protein